MVVVAGGAVEGCDAAPPPPRKERKRPTERAHTHAHMHARCTVQHTLHPVAAAAALGLQKDLGAVRGARGGRQVGAEVDLAPAPF